MSDEKIIVGISQGDINGIGLEVIIKTFLDPQMLEICTPVLFGSVKTASFHRKALNIEDFSFNHIKDISEINHKRANIINVYEEDVDVELGKQTEAGGTYAFKSLHSPAIGTLPSKYLSVRTKTLFTKFPKMATNSLLFLV